MENRINKISAVIITKNEEINIERCLKSLSWVDEIIVVDSGSEDRTVEICLKYNCKIIETKWLGFGKTKQFAVESASNDWIFSIDSDEEVTSELEYKINDILNNPEYNGYKVKRNSFYLGKNIKYSGWNNDFPLRLFNRKHGRFNNKVVHEAVEMDGEVQRITEQLNHYTYQTLEQHIEKVNRYSSLQAEELHEKNKRYSVLLVPFFVLNKFISMYILNFGFLDGKEGFILSYISTFGVFLKYTKLWKLNKK